MMDVVEEVLIGPLQKVLVLVHRLGDVVGEAVGDIGAGVDDRAIANHGGDGAFDPVEQAVRYDSPGHLRLLRERSKQGAGKLDVVEIELLAHFVPDVPLGCGGEVAAVNDDVEVAARRQSLRRR